MSLEKLANTPKDFTINDKVYHVKQLSLFDLSNIREAIFAHKKEQYKKDVAEVASILPEKERSKVILDTIRNYKITEEDIQTELVSRFGVVEALSLGLKISKDEVNKLIIDDNLQDILWDIYCHIMGVDKEVDNQDAEKVNG